MAKTNVKLIYSPLLAVFYMIIISCSNSPDNKNLSSDNKSVRATGYNLSHPDEIIILPAILNEISGITAIDSSSIECIQDENGIIFDFDLLKNEIINKLVFSMDGDYEGIARVGDTTYILRSDGVLFKILNDGSSVLKTDLISTGIPAGNSEGLCYDNLNNRLLIAPKDNLDKASEKKEKRPIYGFDLQSGKLISAPVLDFDLPVIKKFAVDNKVIPREKNKKKNKKNEPDIEFRPSEIGIQPLTNKVFILSGMEHMLFVFDSAGTIEFMEKLNPEIFNMPEGITFLKNGDMFISNEGKNHKATLLRFNYKLK